MFHENFVRKFASVFFCKLFLIARKYSFALKGFQLSRCLAKKLDTYRI